MRLILLSGQSAATAPTGSLPLGLTILLCSGGGSATLPLDLADAVELYLGGLLVPSRLTWAGAGKSPPGTKMPFAVIGGPDLTTDWQEDGSTHPPYDEDGQLPITVIAASRAACKAILATIDQKYPDGLNLAPLVCQDGQVLMIRRTSKGLPVLEDDDAPAGQQAWVGHLMFATIESKNL